MTSQAKLSYTFIMIHNLHQAKTYLADLIKKALRGEEVIIAKNGEPLVRLVPVVVMKKRKLGAWKGKVKVADDFDTLPEEVLRSFEG